MKNKKINIVIACLLAITLVYILIVYPSLPDLIPTHFGVSGDADGYSKKSYIFVIYGILILLNILMPTIAKIDPKRENYSRFFKSFDISRVAINLLFMGLIVIITQSSLSNLTETFSVDRLVPAMLGLVFIVIGNYMPKFKHNYTMGIKTPWTLADENVWNRTHRISGPIWIVAGAIMIINRFLFQNTLSMYIIIVVIIFVVIFPFVYSYLIYRKYHKE
jgi:uncharacterized membrane protein